YFRPDQDLPEEIHASLVDSLYGDLTAMGAGALSTVFGTTLSALKTGNWLLALCAVGAALVGIARFLDARAYRRRPPNCDPAIWELRYGIGAAAHSLVLGSFCFRVCVLTSDEVAHLTCVALTIANAAGITGRNFSSPRIVT